MFILFVHDMQKHKIIKHICSSTTFWIRQFLNALRKYASIFSVTFPLCYCVTHNFKNIVRKNLKLKKLYFRSRIKRLCSECVQKKKWDVSKNFSNCYRLRVYLFNHDCGIWTYGLYFIVLMSSDHVCGQTKTFCEFQNLNPNQTIEILN